MKCSVLPGGKCQTDVYVKSGDADESLRMRPSAFMDEAQELAFMAAETGGFGYSILHPRNWAWVLSRFHFKYTGNPKWQDELHLRTWSKGPEGPFWLREFQLMDAEGNNLMVGTSSWVVLNLETRSMVRPDVIAGMMPDGVTVPESAIAESCPKTVMPRSVEAEFVKEHTVAYSDVDLNGHTNNVRYVIWAMDCLDYGQASKPVKDVRITFAHETHPGEKVSLYKAFTEEINENGETSPVYWIEGRNPEGKQAFTVRLTF